MAGDLHYLRVGDLVVHQMGGSADHPLGEVLSMRARATYTDVDYTWREWWDVESGALCNGAPRELQVCRLRRVPSDDGDRFDLRHLRLGDRVIREHTSAEGVERNIGEVVLIRAAVRGLNHERPWQGWWDVTTGMLCNCPPDAAAAYRIRRATPEEIDRLGPNKRTPSPKDHPKYEMPSSETLAALYDAMMIELEAAAGRPD
ncbi:hypothetical protein NOVOSPHI9U_500008 [Novosphingobium sp. 9U]|nr:hypothetical protein NOVOSPHI9U_500008 [Novosphingobium sp. 9U]